MTERYIDRETMLDLTVNFIPLGILAFFFVLFIAFDPWGWEPLFTTLALALIAWHFLLLALLTWIAGRTIAKEEKTGEPQHTE
ncbi:DUF6684 family protein [Halostella sp. PRR32]|uniref:DUF6684 family protein n=1 Tax=Halostella sp. PRR32 TaxID=3098147 RepID=UPI00296FB52E|nr:DUF6684 family protein [Halostella sp. PRR32]